mgnify:CR=1 FL=1
MAQGLAGASGSHDGRPWLWPLRGLWCRSILHSTASSWLLLDMLSLILCLLRDLWGTRKIALSCLLLHSLLLLYCACSSSWRCSVHCCCLLLTLYISCLRSVRLLRTSLRSLCIRIRPLGIGGCRCITLRRLGYILLPELLYPFLNLLEFVPMKIPCCFSLPLILFA